jgi:hypothetical protein
VEAFEKLEGYKLAKQTSRVVMKSLGVFGRSKAHFSKWKLIVEIWFVQRASHTPKDLPNSLPSLRAVMISRAFPD